MDSTLAIARQIDRQNREVGLGALNLQFVHAPAPTDPRWHPLGPSILANVPAFQQAMQKAPEALVGGAGGKTFLWRTWRYASNWYGGSRKPGQLQPMIFQLAGQGAHQIGPSANHSRPLSLSGAPLGVAQYVPYVKPSPTDPLWRPLASSELARLARTTGWGQALAVAHAHGETLFPFHHGWYQLRGTQLYVLGAGSRPLTTTGTRSLHGVGAQAAPDIANIDSTVVDAATLALSALNADSNYCASVRAPGSAVNTAVHNFKAAWNASYPDAAVPINTGNYEPQVADALSTALSGATVPGGCGTSPAPAPAPAPPPAPGPEPGPSPTPGTSTGPSTTTVVAIGGGVLVAATAIGVALALRKGSAARGGAHKAPKKKSKPTHRHAHA